MLEKGRLTLANDEQVDGEHRGDEAGKSSKRSLGGWARYGAKASAVISLWLTHRLDSDTRHGSGSGSHVIVHATESQLMLLARLQCHIKAGCARF